MAIASNLFSAIMVFLFFAWLVIAGQDKPVTEDLVKSFISSECSSVDQAAEMAQSAVKRLSDMRDMGEITYVEYRKRVSTLNNGLSHWSRDGNLDNYCAAILQSAR